MTTINTLNPKIEKVNLYIEEFGIAFCFLIIGLLFIPLVNLLAILVILLFIPIAILYRCFFWKYSSVNCFCVAYLVSSLIFGTISIQYKNLLSIIDKNTSWEFAQCYSIQALFVWSVLSVMASYLSPKQFYIYPVVSALISVFIAILFFMYGEAEQSHAIAVQLQTLAWTGIIQSILAVLCLLLISYMSARSSKKVS